MNTACASHAWSKGSGQDQPAATQLIEGGLARMSFVGQPRGEKKSCRTRRLTHEPGERSTVV